jgi:hypothetical protein
MVGTGFSCQINAQPGKTARMDISTNLITLEAPPFPAGFELSGE